MASCKGIPSASGGQGLASGTTAHSARTVRAGTLSRRSSHGSGGTRIANRHPRTVHGATRGTAAPLHEPTRQLASCHLAADVGVRVPTRGALIVHIIITFIVLSLLEALEVSPLPLGLPLRRGLRSYVAAAAELRASFTIFLVDAIPRPIRSCSAKDAVNAALHFTRTATHPARPMGPESASAPLPRAAPYPMATPAMVGPVTGSLDALAQSTLGRASTHDRRWPPDRTSLPLRRAAGTLAQGLAHGSCDG